MPDDQAQSRQLGAHPELHGRTDQKDDNSSDGNGTPTDDPSRGEGDR